MTEFLMHWSVAMVFLAAIPATAFPILYARYFPWPQTRLGRALMTKAIGLALLIDISVLYSLFGDAYPGREFVRAVVYTIVAVGLFWQLAAILQIRRESRDDDRP